MSDPQETERNRAHVAALIRQVAALFPEAPITHHAPLRGGAYLVIQRLYLCPSPSLTPLLQRDRARLMAHGIGCVVQSCGGHLYLLRVPLP